MATFDASSAQTSIEMTDALDVNLAGFLYATPSTFAWLTTGGFGIEAESILDDIAQSSGTPTAGTVYSLHAAYSGQVAYNVTGLAASLVSITAAPNLEAYWRAVLAGATTIIAPQQFLFAGMGDFGNVAGKSVTGGDDVFLAFPGANSFHSFAGDANSVASGTLRGGRDTLMIRTEGVYAGEAQSSNGAVIGGNDRIVVMETEAGGIEVIAGDVVTVAAGVVTGGADVIRVRSGPVNSVAGDATSIDAGVVRGGKDLIVLEGSTTSTVTTGDADAMSGGTLYAGADRIFGSTAGNTIFGDVRSQTGGLLKTNATFTGADMIFGSGGGDTLYGQIGADLLRGGADADYLDGGIGADTADYSDKTLAVVATLNGAVNASVSVGGFAEDTIVNIERLNGGSAGDTLTGDGLANRLDGNGGADALSGMGGSDVLIGGFGKDALTGGLAADIFDYDAPGESQGVNADTIAGFSHAQHDRIDLRTIDATPGGANNAFLFAGSQSFAAFNATHSGGVVRAIAGQVQVDIGGNNTVDMIIKTPGATLVGADFLL